MCVTAIAQNVLLDEELTFRHPFHLLDYPNHESILVSDV